MAIYGILFGVVMGQSLWSFFKGDFATASILFVASVGVVVLELKESR